ncbi:MAG: DUF1304 domain-containing protein [Microbacterium sp.]
MLVLGLILAAIAAAIHVYIFVLESLAWTTRARAVFKLTPAEAEATKELAFNQGFYNLFLAVATVIGIVLVAAGQDGPGFALVFVGTGSMLAAALVLLRSSPAKAKSAITQGVTPLLAVILLITALVL